jgi:hypothetical protein
MRDGSHVFARGGSHLPCLFLVIMFSTPSPRYRLTFWFGSLSSLSSESDPVYYSAFPVPLQVRFNFVFHERPPTIDFVDIIEKAVSKDGTSRSFCLFPALEIAKHGREIT